ncbi:tetratricopeptide repeat protein [Nocardiopsis ganjiahuensis]|uniref:tetratricopeptide repeat protein n=1 Tax=Nocardiopsis ganjiahuensis TaxID=239984 RepID=UPI0003488300|nr:tetratricopeptide repeat protein [Nocardiopsis ganjiahuensis]
MTSAESRDDGQGTRVPGGPGWYTDALTLLPVIEDLAEFRRANASDPALRVLEELWSGRPEEAEPLASALVEEAPTVRHRALLADVRRDLGRIAWAVGEYGQLLEDCRGTAREAVLWQHLGKAHFVGGDLREAAEAFSRALQLRVFEGADPALVASSRVAHQRAEALLDRARR